MTRRHGNQTVRLPIGWVPAVVDLPKYVAVRRPSTAASEAITQRISVVAS